MTNLAESNPVTRETCTRYRTRPLVVKLEARMLVIREKGRRDTVSIPYDAIYEFALKIRWREREAEKKAAKKGASKK